MSKTNYRKMSEKAATEPIVGVDLAENPDVTVETPAPAPEPEVTTRNGVVVDCERLNVRQQANATAKVLTVIDKGTEVTIHNFDNKEFYKVSVLVDKKVVNGYCMKKFIK